VSVGVESLGQCVVITAERSDRWGIGMTGRLVAFDAHSSSLMYLVEVQHAMATQGIPLSEVQQHYPTWSGAPPVFQGQWFDEVRLATPEEVAAAQVTQAVSL
jgi:hypothetical protein